MPGDSNVTSSEYPVTRLNGVPGYPRPKYRASVKCYSYRSQRVVRHDAAFSFCKRFPGEYDTK